MSQEKLIKWYIDEYQPFSDYEKFVLESPETNFKREEFGYEHPSIRHEEYDRYFKLMPFCNISSENQRIEVADNGSYFIRELFRRYIYDNTFVLSSTCEHDTTRECLSTVKHKLELYIKEIRSLNIDYIIEKYKESGCNQFVMYMVGTSISSGEIIPQEFFERLKHRLEELNIPHVLILDDVHGMFMTPRDYSIFNFVLYTAHSLVCDYNMGMLISGSRGYVPIGFYDWLGLDEYYTRLDIILKRKDKLRLFKQVLSQYFAEELADTEFFGLHEFTSQHIFSLKTFNLKFTQKQWDKLNEYKIRLGEGDWYQNFARIRFQEFIRQDSDKMIEGLELLKKTLRICRQVYLETKG